MIKENIQNIRQNIIEKALECNRNPKEISLLAVSKKKTIQDIQQAVSVGQYDFGENYIQESIKKIKMLSHLPLIWHFIGTLQSNKTRFVAQYFDWCHTVNSVYIASRLNLQRSYVSNPLNVLIQINISEEENKSGIRLHELLFLAKKINSFPYLKLRGVMAMSDLHMSENCKLALYHKIKKEFQCLKCDHPSVDTLSLGMSSDMDLAIISGSTMLRIGTAIFGKRE
ncbi:YggS family pyridoxal phosphate-dependent enzyme [Candidatus Erwinia haradaeae]|uniref:Pyridoxal phosphate homeostasis protein n=1 Tax=Candidatus Erwinia haradaeae TaxID=1922217 RepID=A0A451D3R0_9GAMM|nr:YggS family pyridoxal phosphate-dependent enzyme [Candidatus Erwinia haradaeae]VFP80312.1 Pyridoxal phosphate homeostasis protein [Candidatus Erwinia haradaeae]